MPWRSSSAKAARSNSIDQTKPPLHVRDRDGEVHGSMVFLHREPSQYNLADVEVVRSHFACRGSMISRPAKTRKSPGLQVINERTP